MPKLPPLSGAELIRALERAGFQRVRQKGGHVSLEKGAHKTVVPLHSDLSKGALLAVLRQTGISKDELIRLR